MSNLPIADIVHRSASRHATYLLLALTPLLKGLLISPIRSLDL